MKKLLYLLTICTLLICSCESDKNDLCNTELKSLDTLSGKYEKMSEEVNNNIGKILNEIPFVVTRSDNLSNGKALMQYLIECPAEEIENLYNEYAKNNHYNNDDDDVIIYDALSEITSEDEAIVFFRFVNNYINRGGNDLLFLENTSKGCSQLIQDAMLKSACIIDNILDGEGLQISSSRGYCIEQLKIELIKGLVKNEIVDLIVEALETMPGLDAIGAALFVGYDLGDAIETAYKFNLCCAKNWN